MSKEILFASAARTKMARGAKILADAVKVTLGPKGKNVVIEQDFGAPLIVNDGVTIAKSITLFDKFENMGAAILIEAASKPRMRQAKLAVSGQHSQREDVSW